MRQIRNLRIALLVVTLFAVLASYKWYSWQDVALRRAATPAVVAKDGLNAARYFGGLLAREGEFTRQKQCRSRLIKQIIDFATVSPEVKSTFIEACLDDVRARQRARAKTKPAPKAAASQDAEKITIEQFIQMHYAAVK